MMSKIDWKDPGHKLAIIGLVLAVISIVVALATADESREFIVQHWPYWPLCILVLVAMSWAISVRHENALLRGKLAEPHFVRFEELTRIRYGHVAYYPFMDYQRHNHQPVGVGLRVLEELFGANVLVANPDGSTWANMIDRLVDGECDIIATPLFETRERSSRVAFSNPMFFADIGIYLRKENANGNSPFTLSRARDQLRVLSRSIHAEVIVGEISEKMVKKFLALPDDRVTHLPSTEVHVSNLFKNLVAHDRQADIVFAERFLAESLAEVKSNQVVNILRTKELLYPVGFAMRKEDYVLRNYINIKMMALDDKQPNRLMGFIINELKSHKGFEWIDVSNAREFFVREKNA